MTQAMSIVQTWIDQLNVRIIEPGPRYWSIMNRLAHDVAFGGNLVIDAHLVALAIENDATVCTADADFNRFPGVRVINPVA
jgi:predicted nucleic acid-binding protein